MTDVSISHVAQTVTRDYTLYIIDFPNGGFYIGITGDIRRRFHGHTKDARDGSKLPVHHAIRKYGMQPLTALAVGPRDYIAAMEIRAIATLAPRYNISAGGDISPMLNEATRAKVAASMRERFKDPAIRQANKDAQRIAQSRPEVIAKRTLKLRGRKFSAEVRANMSAAQKGKIIPPEAIAKSAASRTGAKRSDESRQRMSEGQKKRVRTPEEIARMTEMANNRVMTDEYRANIKAAALRRWAKARGEIPE